MLMRIIRRTLRSEMFTGCMVGFAGMLLSFNLMWFGSECDAIVAIIGSVLIGFLAFLGYMSLIEDPREKYFRTHFGPDGELR